MRISTRMGEAAWLAVVSLFMLALAIPLGMLVFLAAGSLPARLLLAGCIVAYFGTCQFQLSRGRADALPHDWRLILTLNGPFLLLAAVAPAVGAWIAAPYVAAAAAAALLCSCAGAGAAALRARVPKRRR